ncbi:MAG: hypothetical protein NTZ21_12040 [Actinobacteria bacterium]|nr:hypothetical protein [Actinomycetota bacterium]
MSAPDATGRPPSRRLDASGPGTADLAGVRLTLGTLLRWSPVVAVAALVGWALGTSLPDIGRPNSATVTLGLTDQVVWPFYDAVVARQPALLDEGSVLADAQATTGVVADDVEFDLDTGQTNAVIRLVVDASSTDEAVTLADAIGTALVDANLAEQRATVQERIDALTTRLDRRRERLDELAVQRDEALFSGRADDADQAREAAIVVANGIAGLEDQLTDAEVELESMQPRLAVVAPAVAGRDRSDDVRANAVTAALLALVAVALVPTLDRQISRVRSAAQLRRIWPGVPVLDERRGSDLLGATAADAARRMGDDGRLAVTVLALDQRSAAVLEADDLADRYHVIAPGTDGWADAWTAVLDADVVVIAARRGSVRVRRAERVADELLALGVVPRAVVITRR